MIKMMSTKTDTNATDVTMDDCVTSYGSGDVRGVRIVTQLAGQGWEAELKGPRDEANWDKEPDGSKLETE